MKNQILNYLTKDIRFDTRKLEELRDIKVTENISKNSEGSVIIEMGKTKLAIGVKLSIGTPFSDRPDEGTLMVNAELTPLSSDNFENGPPSIEAIELSRVIDRGIRESHAVDLKSLCITPGEKVWMVTIDICPLNHDGNIMDAAGIGAILALKRTKLPNIDEEGKADYKNRSKKSIKMNHTPIPVTIYKIQNHLIVDPTYEEEQIADARLTTTLIEDNQICSLQKGLDTPLSISEIEKMVDLSIEKSQEIRKKLNL